MSHVQRILLFESHISGCNLPHYIRLRWKAQGQRSWLEAFSRLEFPDSDRSRSVALRVIVAGLFTVRCRSERSQTSGDQTLPNLDPTILS